MADMSSYFLDMEPSMNDTSVGIAQFASYSASHDYAEPLVGEVQRDKKHLSLGMLVPDAIQHICAEGSALHWDANQSLYEVFRFFLFQKIMMIISKFQVHGLSASLIFVASS